MQTNRKDLNDAYEVISQHYSMLQHRYSLLHMQKYELFHCQQNMFLIKIQLPFNPSKGFQTRSFSESRKMHAEECQYRC